MNSSPNRVIFRGAKLALALLVFCSGFTALSAQNPEGTPPAAAAQEPEQNRIEEALKGLNRGRSVLQVAVSPDGKHVAWVEWAGDGQEIRVARIEDLQKSERVSAAPKNEETCLENEIAWAPDAKALAFFSDCAHPGKQANLYLSRLNGEPARRLTDLKGAVDAPAFSPDGTRIAFLYVEGATRTAGALAAMKPPAGVIGEDGVEIQRVAVAAIAQSGPIRTGLLSLEQVSPANLHVYEFDWRRDSKGFAYVGADPPGENNWWVAKLYTQTIGEPPKVVLAPATVEGALHGLQIAVPRWSPDGKDIAFIGGLMSDQGATGGDVWMVPAEGGVPHNLSQGRPTTSVWLEWGSDEFLYVSELAGGNSQLIRYRLNRQVAGSDLATVIFLICALNLSWI